MYSSDEIGLLEGGDGIVLHSSWEAELRFGGLYQPERILIIRVLATVHLVYIAFLLHFMRLASAHVIL